MIAFEQLPSQSPPTPQLSLPPPPPSPSRASPPHVSVTALDSHVDGKTFFTAANHRRRRRSRTPQPQPRLRAHHQPQSTTPPALHSLLRQLYGPLLPYARYDAHDDGGGHRFGYEQQQQPPPATPDGHLTSGVGGAAAAAAAAAFDDPSARFNFTLTFGGGAVATNESLLSAAATTAASSAAATVASTLANATATAAATATATSAVDDDFPRWWALSAVVLVLGTAAGNVLVCLAIYWERRLQNVTNYFLMSLAITDLMVAMLVMPMGILSLVQGKFPFCLFVFSIIYSPNQW